MPSDPKAWFAHDRFGMFIHWGLYTLHADAEWHWSYNEVDREEYFKYLDYFDPDLYDPREWARLARKAGMTHMTLTAKHHDGFCLWPSQHSEFTVTKTPHGKDLIGPFVEACRAEGLKVGLYYSLIDWHHRDFGIDIFHPMRNIEDPEGYNAGCDVARYQAFMKAQVRELLENYGRIDHLFMDFSYPDQIYRGLPGKGRDYWDSANLIALVRELQPDIIVNNRMDLTDVAADFYTPECFIPNARPTRNGEPVLFEAAFNTNEAWQHKRTGTQPKSPHQLLQTLIDMIAMGGNLLMNVGPTARGDIDAENTAALKAYEEWFARHERAIRGCGHSTFDAPFGCRLTQNGNRLYIHLYNWPYRHLYVKGLGGKVAYAQLLDDASEITWLPPGRQVRGEGEGLRGLDPVAMPDDLLILELPVAKPGAVIPVIELFLKD
ncbi:alpha-L-fucosidase [Blastomonas fulva]|jgi:alpha-L-fucosidase|uniref:alpha-L-fucosidase n=1 Tax=Blastomonas fulva TaxID=1550728 RepID=UPI003D2B5883